MKTIKVLAYLGPSAARWYRAEMPFKYLNRKKTFECIISPTDVQDEQLLWADIIYVQGLVDPQMIATLWAYKDKRNKKIVVDRDDVFEVTQDNPWKTKHDKASSITWSKELTKIADRVIVTTNTIKKEVQELNPYVTRLPNYLDMEVWDKPRIENPYKTVRIGWIGSATHRKDLESVMPALKKILMARDAKFIFCGDDYPIQLLGDIPKNKWQYVPGIKNYYMYPNLIRSLSLDIGIAPLVDNHFNAGRSNLKFLEYAMLHVPGVYSPIAYADSVYHAKNGFIALNDKEWYTYLDILVTNKSLRERMGHYAYTYVRTKYDIKGHYLKWGKLFKQLINGI